MPPILPVSIVASRPLTARQPRAPAETGATRLQPESGLGLPARPGLKGVWMSSPILFRGEAPLSDKDKQFIRHLEQAYDQHGINRMRIKYLEDSGTSSVWTDESVALPEDPAIEKHLENPQTFEQIKCLHLQHPEDEVIRRLYGAALRDQLALRHKKTLPDFLDLPDKQDGKYRQPGGKGRYLQDKFRRIREAIDQFYVYSFHLMKQLGFPTPMDYYATVTAINLKSLGEKAKQVFRHTDFLYDRALGVPCLTLPDYTFTPSLEKASDLLGKMHDDLHRIPALSCLNPQDVAKKTFDAMSLDWTRLVMPVTFAYPQGGAQAFQDFVLYDDPERPPILLDFGDRAGKNKRASIYPARVPRELWISVPQENSPLNTAYTLLHELGHGVSYAHMPEEIGYARSRMGNSAVTETYAYLFANLWQNTDWLRHVVGATPEQARRIAGFVALDELKKFRLYACKLLFELAIHDGTPVADKPKQYLDGMVRDKTGISDYYSQFWPEKVDPDFYVASYFVAFTLEAQLRQYLEDRFGGEAWYRNPYAMDFLKDLWREGSISPDVLSRRLGVNDPTDIGAFMAFTQRRLSAVSFLEPPKTR